MKRKYIIMSKFAASNGNMTKNIILQKELFISKH